MPTQKQFNETKAYVLDRIRNYSTVKLPQITGDMILGPEIWKDGKLDTPGLGFGAGLRSNLQNDLNAWLRSKPHKRLLHYEELEADVTVKELVNYTAYCLI